MQGGSNDYIPNPILTNQEVKQMKKALEFLKRMKDEKGAAAVEYGIMVALIAAVIVLTVTTLGQQVNAAFVKVVNALK